MAQMKSAQLAELRALDADQLLVVYDRALSVYEICSYPTISLSSVQADRNRSPKCTLQQSEKRPLWFEVAALV